MTPVRARLFVLFGAALLIALPAHAEAKYPATTIRSLDSGETITVASEDVARLVTTYGFSPSSQRFWQTDFSPQPLALLPADPGPAFEVIDDYWDQLATYHALPGTAEESVAYPKATYYPAAAVTELTSASGSQFWFQLDSGRHALLLRYIALLEQEITGPSFFDVLRVARETRHEQVSVRLRVNGQMILLSSDQGDRFWPVFLSASPRADLRPADFEGGDGSHFGRWRGGYWPVHRDQDVRIELTLPEGRRLEYTLFRPEGFLARAPEGWPNWPAFDASEELLSAIEELVGPSRVNHRVPPEPNMSPILSPPRAPVGDSVAKQTEPAVLTRADGAIAGIEARGAVVAAILVSVAAGSLVMRRRGER